MNSENMKLIDKLSLTSRSVNGFIDRKKSKQKKPKEK